MNIKCTIARLAPLLILSGLFTHPSYAWDDHHIVTAAALRDVADLKNREVVFVPIDLAVQKLGFLSFEAFRNEYKWNKRFTFESRLDERPGQKIQILNILTTYSHEPDFGQTISGTVTSMDTRIFEPDQYPELWRDEYSMMAGRNPGTPSQAWRYMYWGPFRWESALSTIKLPLNMLGKSMGHAPERAQIFIDLARQARKAGLEYWAVRFVANALHYIEDLSMPFHTAQVPTLKYLVIPFTSEYGRGLTEYVAQMTNVISYYHFGVEDYLAEMMKKPEGSFLWDYVASPFSGDANLSYSDRNVTSLALNLAQFSNAFAARLGQASIDFFPPLNEDLVTSKPREYLHRPEVWSEVARRGSSDSAEKRAYFFAVREVLSAGGQAVRAVVSGEILSPPKK